MKKLVLTILCVVAAAPVAAQATTTPPQWQINAGGTQKFEVASIREDKGDFKPPSFALSNDDSFPDPNGRFYADFTLPTYIGFAYKFWLTGEEQDAMLAHLPGWMKKERFEIQATAPTHATKDQYRLMMQTLLAERFGLKLHFEQSEKPILAMTLVKPGQPGPKLIPHSQGQPCDETPKPETFPCYGFNAKPVPNGLFMFGSRATSTDLIASFVGSLAGQIGEIGRRVVDQTGLSGLWDFTLEIAPVSKSSSPDATAPGPTMLEALRDQLGIKLTPTRAGVSLPVIDHIEQPSEN